MAIPCVHRCSTRASVDAGNEKAVINASLLAVLALVLVMMLPWLRAWHPAPEARELVDGKQEPVALVDHIDQSAYQGPMYNNLNWGSYLIYRLWPRYQVFADNRLQIIPEEIWQEVWDVHRGLASWSRILDRRGVTWAVLGKMDNQRTVEFMRLDPGWVVDYEDDMGVIFVRAAAEAATERLE